MSAGLYVAIAILVLILITIAQGVRLVPQGYQWVVQRFGKYQQTLMPGLNIIIPYFDKVAYKLTTKQIVLDIPSQEVITKDNAIIITSAVGYISIVDPQKAVYGVDNYSFAIQTKVQTTLRSIIGEMDLDNALSSRDQIKSRLTDTIANEIEEWGISLRSVEIQDINPSETMQAAMEAQASAERARRATVTKAEGSKEAQILEATGAKQAQILEAQGRKEAAEQDAKAEILLAEARQQAISLVSEPMNDKDLAVMYLLGEKYITSIGKLAASPNSKSVILPADLPKAIQGMIGR
ncbi:MAG: regulator of protease activity HflC (stomatin/prohibitin superfamily) [Oleiphilaceae bacterium]|jgi:regulator of protease activity HflC (stomatin/prohibitin superfamily)